MADGMIAKRVWRCGECYTSHEFASDARECCAPDVRLGYECPRCDEFHEQIEDAEDCCPPEDEQQTDPAKLREELEQAGQVRLPI